MRKEYLLPFVKVAQEVAEKHFGLEVSKGDYHLEETLGWEKEITIAVAIKGELTGLVLIGIGLKDAIKLASYVLERHGEPSSGKWDENAQDIMREFGNIVVGNMTHVLDQLGFECDISTPHFIDPKTLINFQEESIYFELKNRIADIAIKIHIKN